MKANELLLWLSARREGSWQQFRAAVEELHSGDGETGAEDNDEFPLHQQLRLDLERLAHVEFFARDCEKGWRVAPPTLAGHPVPGGVRGVLCGARSPALRERVLRVAGELVCETRDSPGVPEIIRLVAGDAEALAAVAQQVSLRFQPDAPLAILSHLPPCDPPTRGGNQAEFPVGVNCSIREFDTATLCWKETDRARTHVTSYGLFRFQLPFQPRCHFLRWAGGTFSLSHRVALYVLLKRNRRKLLRYDTTTRAFSLPAKCPPPRLLERALVLCSGLPPVYDAATARLTYAEVPMEIASFAAELLRQPLR